jgi:hypothetical protein
MPASPRARAAEDHTKIGRKFGDTIRRYVDEIKIGTKVRRAEEGHLVLTAWLPRPGIEPMLTMEKIGEDRI